MTDRKRIALITGGAGALGVAAGATLASRGFITYLIDMDGSRAQASAESLTFGGHDVRGLQVDVTDATAVRQAVGLIAAEHGGIDALVNMAGAVRNASFSKITQEDFDLTMHTHVYGTLNCMQAVAPVMRERLFGRIVNISSVASLGAVGGGAYSAAKGAIESMSRTAAIEMAARGITVNCVAPGLVAAGMFLTTPQSFQDEGVARTPMKRAGTPKEIADCIAFFVSPEASFVTGQTLFVCGGVSIGY